MFVFHIDFNRKILNQEYSDSNRYQKCVVAKDSESAIKALRYFEVELDKDRFDYIVELTVNEIRPVDTVFCLQFRPYEKVRLWSFRVEFYDLDLLNKSECVIIAESPEDAIESLKMNFKNRNINILSVKDSEYVRISLVDFIKGYYVD